MLAATILFFNLLAASLLVGSMFGVWLIFNPAGLGASAYVALHQQGIRTLNVALPALGAVTLALTLASAAVARNDYSRLGLLLGAFVFLLAAGLITRFLNQPINAVVITWPVDAPPADWTLLRDDWWRWHVTRLIAGTVGLSLLVVAALKQTGGN